MNGTIIDENGDSNLDPDYRESEDDDDDTEELFYENVTYYMQRMNFSSNKTYIDVVDQRRTCVEIDECGTNPCGNFLVNSDNLTNTSHTCIDFIGG